MNQTWDSARRFRWGLSSIACGAVLAAALLYPSLHGEEAVALAPIESTEEAPAVLPEMAAVAPEPIAVEVPDLSQALAFLAIPPHPDGGESRVGVQIKGSGQIKWVHLPVRIGLRYDEDGELRFADDATRFWIDIASGEYEVGVRTGIEGGEREWTQGWGEVPLRTPLQFADGTPFRSWEEVRFVGTDLLLARFLAPESSPRYRIERGDRSVWELRAGDCLYWNQGDWSLEGSGPVVRVRGVEADQLILEGWDGEGYARMALPLQTTAAPRLQTEELFTTVRIRSDRQLSCILEKQCMVLRAGDWVVKEEGRWRVLRRPEERTEYLHRREEKDLFVLERIEMKGTQRVAYGAYFAPNRTAFQPMTLVAQGPQRTLKGVSRRGAK